VTALVTPVPDALCSALPAGMLSFASPKESSQRKGDPNLRGRLRRLPCATRRAGRLRNSARWASDSPRRHLPAHLRCSALQMGAWNTDHSLNDSGQITRNHTTSPRIDHQPITYRSVFHSPSASSSSAGRTGGVGLPCLSRRRVLARRPADRAAQSTRQRRATQRARLFFGDFLLPTQKKVARASGAKTNAPENTTAQPKAKPTCAP